MNRTLLRLAAACALLAPGPAAFAGILSGNCRIADQPAATLLYPYFETDLDRSDGTTTLISINNASSRPTLTRVVLWTDWGVPTLAFDLYLTGYDIQSLNLRDVMHGLIPGTGPGISPNGPLSDTGTVFPGCGATQHAASGLDRDYLQAAHTGRPLPGTAPAQCLSSGSRGSRIATGYVTVDVANRCSPTTTGGTQNTPADPAYFKAGGTGLAADNNVLWGEYFYVDPSRNSSDSQTAVHIVADPDAFSAGDYTFYGRYVGFDSRDDRAPLSSLYYVRYLNGGPFSGGTDLVVWRDNRSSVTSARSCGGSPEWAPLGEFQLVAFDEEENPEEIPHSRAFPLTTQKVHVGSDSLSVGDNFGWMMIDLWHPDATHAQGWVGVVMTAEGRFSVSHQAIRADDLCNFGL